MLMLTQRLGTLDPKAKLATRTAKDGEEYSQLVFEVTDLEVTDVEVNAVFASPHAYDALKALHAAVKGIKAIELDEKIEGATVIVRLAAVSVQNGPEFTFNDCRIDKLKFARLESESLSCSYRVTAKPALNGQFGELVARFGHTAMIELRGESPNAQGDLPLNSVGKGERGASSIGTPEEERDRAHAREREIAGRLEDVHENGDGPDDDEDGDDEGEGEMSELGQQIGNAERKGPLRAKRRSTVTGDAVN